MWFCRPHRFANRWPRRSIPAHPPIGGWSFRQTGDCSEQCGWAGVMASETAIAVTATIAFARTQRAAFCAARVFLAWRWRFGGFAPPAMVPRLGPWSDGGAEGGWPGEGRATNNHNNYNFSRTHSRSQEAIARTSQDHDQFATAPELPSASLKLNTRT